MTIVAGEELSVATAPNNPVTVPGGEGNAMSQQLALALVQAAQAAQVAGGATININLTSDNHSQIQNHTTINYGQGNAETTGKMLTDIKEMLTDIKNSVENLHARIDHLEENINEKFLQQCHQNKESMSTVQKAAASSEKEDKENVEPSRQVRNSFRIWF
jgi:hypothetical protein